jgi:hypothetical protein
VLRPWGRGGEGRADELNGGVTAGWEVMEGVSPVASSLATVVTAVELKSGGNERGRTPGWCEGGGVLGHLF